MHHVDSQKWSCWLTIKCRERLQRRRGQRGRSQRGGGMQWRRQQGTNSGGASNMSLSELYQLPVQCTVNLPSVQHKIHSGQHGLLVYKLDVTNLIDYCNSLTRQVTSRSRHAKVVLSRQMHTVHFETQLPRVASIQVSWHLRDTHTYTDTCWLIQFGWWQFHACRTAPLRVEIPKFACGERSPT